MSSFRLVEDSATYVRAEDFFDHVALVAHNCYQVSEKDHESNVLFLSRLIANGHLAMIEHYRFLFRLREEAYQEIRQFDDAYQDRFEDKGRYYVSTSLRPLLESQGERRNAYRVLMSALSADIQKVLGEFANREGAMLVSPERENLSREHYLLSVYPTYHLITDRGVTHELVRHRPCSFAQESTRYCNYSKDKFENCLTFIKPLRYEEMKTIYDRFFQEASDAYFALLEAGAKPQEARSVLSNALKASIMVTCSLKEWIHILALRCSPFAHPDIRRVMEKVRDDLLQRKLLLPEECHE